MTAEAGWTFDLSGSHLALDFANTTSQRHTADPIERLTTWDRVTSFAVQTGLIGAEQPGPWRDLPEAERDRLVVEARLLREALYATFAAVAEGREPPVEALAEVNRWVRRLELGPDLQWRWADPDAPQAILAPVVRSAIDLLVSDQRGRVRICDADDCVWLFLDLSKNRSRRWCDMKQCGNRAKARRFHARHG